jgi:hypothetical protein
LLLRQITHGLLQTDNYAQRLDAANALYAMLSEITKVSFNTQDPLYLEETQLGEGKALSPRDATRCITDFMRTAGFISGLRAAIIEARRRFPDETIHVLYAGCGPFAPLMIPLTTEFDATQVQFTLLDIHKQSLDAARQIVCALGLKDFVRDYVRADATSYQHPPESALHIVLTETMQRVLSKEPQVMITSNLVPQLVEGGILVPQKITLRTALADVNQEHAFADNNDAASHDTKRQRIYLGQVFELTAESSRGVRDWPTTKENLGARTSPPIRLSVPQLNGHAYKLMLLTEITVFDSIVIGDYHSGITYPVVCDELDGIESGSQIEFHYQTGAHPGLQYRIL